MGEVKRSKAPGRRSLQGAGEASARAMFRPRPRLSALEHLRTRVPPATGKGAQATAPKYRAGTPIRSVRQSTGGALPQLE